MEPSLPHELASKLAEAIYDNIMVNGIAELGTLAAMLAGDLSVEAYLRGEDIEDESEEEA